MNLNVTITLWQFDSFPRIEPSSMTVVNRRRSITRGYATPKWGKPQLKKQIVCLCSFALYLAFEQTSIMTCQLPKASRSLHLQLPWLGLGGTHCLFSSPARPPTDPPFNWLSLMRLICLSLSLSLFTSPSTWPSCSPFAATGPQGT